MKSLMLVLAATLPASAQDGKREEVDAKLRNMRVTLDFKEAPIDTVIDYLREISDINIFLDGKVKDKNIVVSLKVSDLSLKSVFGLILKPQGCDTMFRDGVLVVMTREDVVDKTVRMQIYDCRDILYPIHDFPGVDIDLSKGGIGVTILGQDDGGSPEAPIEELVKAHTGGRSWEENQKCVCRLTNGLLVVKNTPEVHQQVVRLLDMLRRNK
jgi:type II secretory pathway component GspD/PulD (secretin)